MVGEYQFLHFNLAGIIDRAERIRLSCDDAALERARTAVADAKIEIWQGGRRIGVVPPRLFKNAVAAGSRARR